MQHAYLDGHIVSSYEWHRSLCLDKARPTVRILESWGFDELVPFSLGNFLVHLLQFHVEQVLNGPVGYVVPDDD